MSTSSNAVTLRLDTVLQVAKDTIKPGGWTCEWNVAPDLKTPEPCRIVLNSWMSYFKHISRHVKDNLTSGGAVKCRMPRCNMLSGGTTYNTLLTHIQDSHMRNVHLPCPFRRCSSFSFNRGTSLEKHILEQHADAIGKPISYLSSVLLPSRAPFRPAVLNLPPLPYMLTTHGSAILPPVPGTTRQNAQQTLRAEGSRTSVVPSSPSKRRPRMQERDMSIALDAMHVDRLDTPPSSPTIAFADLPKIELNWDTIADRPEDQKRFRSLYEVQPVMDPWVDVGRPQAIIDLTLPEFIPRPPPASILYDAFIVLNNLQNAGEEEDEPASQATSLPPPTQGSETKVAGAGKEKPVLNATS